MVSLAYRRARVAWGENYKYNTVAGPHPTIIDSLGWLWAELNCGMLDARTNPCLRAKDSGIFAFGINHLDLPDEGAETAQPFLQHTPCFFEGQDYRVRGM